MELSQAWEPGDRERAWKLYTGKRSLRHVHSRNMEDEARLKIMKCRLKFDHMFSVPKVNRGGGLALFWKESMNFRWKHHQKIILTVS